MITSQVIYGLVALPVIFVVLHLRRPSTPFPPGPYALPVVGNLFNFVRREPWKITNAWKKKFGGLVGLRVFGQSIVFIEDGAMALELLNKRGHIYSDRPSPVMACGMCKLDRLALFTPFGEQFKSERRIYTSFFTSVSVQQRETVLTEEIHKLLHQLHVAPNEFASHVIVSMETIMYRTICGYRSNYAAKGAASPRGLLAAGFDKVAGGWLVDFFPIIRWLPGAKCRQVASDLRAQWNSWVNDLEEDFCLAPNSDEKERSFYGQQLKSSRPSTETSQDHKIGWLAAALIVAGTDTSSVSLTQFILSMVLFPDIQMKAQKLLDDVVGLDRLPTLADRSKLVYIDCLLRECIRWGTPLSICPPHRLMEDDEINGYFLPAGTVLFPNIWSMFHDDDVYPEASMFNPERFIGLFQRCTPDDRQASTPRVQVNPDPYIYLFGFGRRRCTGAYFGDQTLWLAIASILATFSIEPYKDSTGDVFPPNDVIDVGAILRMPKPFKCRFTPRFGR